MTNARVDLGGFVATPNGWSAGVTIPLVRRWVTLPSARQLAILGVGDVAVWGAHTFASQSVFGGSLAAGITAPTGMQGNLDGEDLRLDDLATGAGALWVNARGESTIDVPLGEFFASADLAAPLVHTRAERAGLAAGARVGLAIEPLEVLRFEGAAVGYVVGASTHSDGSRVVDTGGEWLAVGATVRVQLPVGLGFDLGGELPVRESMRGVQDRGWTARLGVGFSPAAGR